MLPEIVQKQIDYIAERCKDIKPLVVIKCLTFNHEPYLKDALEGFIMQKTNFPFVAIVHEDASTDSTAKVLKEYAEKYPNIIFPIFEKENQWSKTDGSLGEIMNTAIAVTGAKYIAYCEGDDYWIDPLKLQKQVDFLETHPNYGMCCTNSLRYYKSINKYIKSNIESIINTKTLLNGNNITTASVVITSDIYQLYLKYDINKKINNLLMGDYPLWLFISIFSNIKLLNDTTSCYRVLYNSASHGNFIRNLKFEESAIKIKEFFIKEYNLRIKIDEINKLKNKLLIYINEKDKKRVNKLKKEIKKIKSMKFKKFILVYFTKLVYQLDKWRYKESIRPSYIHYLYYKLKYKIN